MSARPTEAAPRGSEADPEQGSDPAGPLAGLRVLELASGIAGPYAGRLLAMLGATVVKREPASGDPAREQALDDRPLQATSPLFLHLNAGKRNVALGETPLAALLADADIVIDDRTRAEAAGTPVALDRLASAGLDVVLASVTPWGYEAARGGGMDEELLVQAASGVAAAATVPGEGPLRLPGWQLQYLAGAYAAAGAVALCAERRGVRHLDVPWVSCAASGIELSVSIALHAGVREITSREAGLQAGSFPAGVFACADGHVIPGTVRPIDWVLQCGVYGKPELLEDARFSRRERGANRAALREIIQPWYDAHKKREILGLALDAGWAFAMVMTARDALADEHLAARGFLQAMEGPEGGFTAPGQPWIARGLPPPAPRVAARGEHAAQPRPASGRSASGPEFRIPSLANVRVLELTRAWAGPFVGRFLGALGADVVKLEAGRSPDGWRTRQRWKRAGVVLPPGQDPEAYTWDATAHFNALNRNKRGLSLDATRAGGPDLLLRLIERADIVLFNMTHRMAEEWDLSFERLSRVNPGLVLIQMPALGASGPYRAMPGYGTLIEGMGGFAARFGPRSEPARGTNTYYPDAVAGIHATLAALSGLAQRERSGRGVSIDLSQQEAMWLMLGEGIVLASRDGREPERMGNAEPGCAPSGFYPCADGRWIALVVRGETEFARLVAAAGGALGAVAGWSAEQRTARREALDAALAAWTGAHPLDTVLRSLGSAGLAAHAVEHFAGLEERAPFAELELVERVLHPVTGSRACLRVPLRVDGRAIATRLAAPVFDQHTDAVLRDWLALDARAIAQLRSARVVGTLPSSPGDES